MSVEALFWTISPYIFISIFVLGMIYRYRYDQFSWTAKSSQLMERKKLIIGSILFHIGILLVIAGHFFGLLIPESWTEALGITEQMYHSVAVVAGMLFGLTTLAGMIILTWRRLTDLRVRSIGTFSDIAVNIVLITVIVLGLSATIFGTATYTDFNYRESISVWFRQIFIFQPNGELMLDVPFIFKIHIVAAFTLLALFPFTRLVHAFSIPIAYIFRRPIIYRKNVRRGA